MSEGYKLWLLCPLCKGTGLTGDEGAEDPNCVFCGGKKFIAGGWCSADTYTLPEDLPPIPEEPE